MIEEDTIPEMVQQNDITEVPLSAIDFPISSEEFAQWDEIIDPLIEADKREYPDDTLAVIVGRFQPPHKGHAFGMYAALKKVNTKGGKLVIVVGSPKEQPQEGSAEDMRHPLPFGERKLLLLNVAKKLEKKLGIESIEKKIYFVDMHDVENDQLWGEEVIKQVEGRFGHIDVVIANDGRRPGTPERTGAVQGIFEHLGENPKRVLVVPFFKREENQGTLLRTTKNVFGAGGRNRVNWEK